VVFRQELSEFSGCVGRVAAWTLEAKN